LPKAVIRLIDIDAETLLADSQRRRWASQTGVDSPAYRAGIPGKSNRKVAIAYDKDLYMDDTP
jgi:hypothetical protein